MPPGMANKNFTDHRPETAAQRKMIQRMEKSTNQSIGAQRSLEPSTTRLPTQLWGKGKRRKPIQEEEDGIEMQDMHGGGGQGHLPAVPFPVVHPGVQAPVVPAPVAPVAPRVPTVAEQMAERSATIRRHRARNPQAKSPPSFAPPGHVPRPQAPVAPPRPRLKGGSMTMTEMRRRDDKPERDGQLNHNGDGAARVAVGGGGRQQSQGSSTFTMMASPHQEQEPPAQHLILRLRGAEAPAPANGMTPVLDGNHPLGPNWQGGQVEEPAPAPVPVPAPVAQAPPANHALQQELDALGTGRRDQTHYGTGQQGDLRAVTTDPRFRYRVHRPNDHIQNPVRRGLANVKEKVKDTADKALKTVGIRENAPGEDFHQGYERRNETTTDKVKRIAKKGGRMAAEQAIGRVPVLSTGRTVLSAVNAHQQAKAAEEVAQDDTASPAVRSIGTGLAERAKKQRRDQTIGAVGGVVSEAANVVGAGPVASHVISAGRQAVSAATKIHDAATAKDREARMNADVDVHDPALAPGQLDQANAALEQLPAHDPEAADAMLQHLALPPMDHNAHVNAQGQVNRHDQELALNRDLQRGRVNPANGGQEHTLLPSEVSRQARRENARLRLRAAAGPHLGRLVDSQARDWTDVAMDGGRAAIRGVRRIAASASSSSSSSHEEDSVEMEDFSGRPHGGQDHDEEHDH